jgi:hypothetical protein
MTRTLAMALAFAALAGGPVLAAAAKAAPAKPAAGAKAWAALPDWSGTWQMVGGTVFDTETVSQKGVQAGTAGLREHPPYNAQWEERYVKNIQGVADGSFPDPLTFCGIPAGMPRMINVPDGYEWVVTPKMVWETTENATGLRRIYTDGRGHPKDPGHTYYGHSIGHWEGDTLVVDTVGMRGDTILDRTGVQLSDQRHTVERIRKIDDNTLEDRMTIDDPVALTRPWTIVKRFRKLPKGTYIFDYACAENNRNPVDANGRTITLDENGKPLHD